MDTWTCSLPHLRDIIQHIGAERTGGRDRDIPACGKTHASEDGNAGKIPIPTSGPGVVRSGSPTREAKAAEEKKQEKTSGKRRRRLWFVDCFLVD
jgi:hypothetical protein